MSDQEKSFQFINDTILTLVEVMCEATEYSEERSAFSHIKTLVEARKILEAIHQC